MKQDQYLKIQGLTSEIAEVVIVDADPKNWVGHGKPSSQMTRDERGDAYWSRKMAAASLALLQRMMYLTEAVQRVEASAAAAGQPDVDDAKLLQAELDQDIAAAEKEAERLLARARKATA